MRKSCLAMLMMAMGVLCAGCPSAEQALVGTDWAVSVADASGRVDPYDGEATLGDLSGVWYFKTDGTLAIANAFGSRLAGTYTLEGRTVEFTARIDNSEKSGVRAIEEHVWISGTLAYAGATLAGDGSYRVAYRNSEHPDDAYSQSGACLIDGAAPPFSPAWFSAISDASI